MPIIAGPDGISSAAIRNQLIVHALQMCFVSRRHRDWRRPTASISQRMTDLFLDWSAVDLSIYNYNYRRPTTNGAPHRRSSTCL